MVNEKGRVLLSLARAAASGTGGQAGETSVLLPWLDEPGACFVTLTRNNELRGCIGTLVPYRSLKEDVEENARAAAFSDPRFPPVNAREWNSLRFEVSLLSVLEPLSFEDERSAVAQLHPGFGFLLESGFHKGTFLPQVWDQLTEPHSFWTHLKVKAGLPAYFWDPNFRISRYTVKKWKEE